jgi:hypothetical protein
MKNLNNSRFVLFLGVVVLFMLFAACGGGPAPQSSPAPEQKPASDSPADPQPAAPPPASTPAPAPSSSAGGSLILTGSTNYKVVKDDTLSLIAASKYGRANMFYFPLIRLANAGIVSDPDVLYPNANLVIPDLQQNLNNAGAKALIRDDMLSVAAQYDRKNMPKAAAELRRLAATLAR